VDTAVSRKVTHKGQVLWEDVFRTHYLPEGALTTPTP
jgi:hypothetical protein